MIIYPKQYPDSPWGHVVIVTDVKENSICIAEQNWEETRWQGNYARQLEMINTGNVFLVDNEGYEILGWMRAHTP